MDLKATAVGGVFLVPHHSWDRAPVQGEAAQYKLLPDKCNYQKRGGGKINKVKNTQPRFRTVIYNSEFPRTYQVLTF